SHGQRAPHVSPVKELVLKLMSDIEEAVKKVSPKPDSPSVVLDYFLGKPNGATRSYRSDSPEEECNRRMQAFLEDERQDHVVKQFELMAEELRENVLEAKRKAETESVNLFSSKDTKPVTGDPALDDAIWIARNALGHYYQDYEDYDLLTYPIMFETGVGEADPIDIIRISPEDAKQLIDERATGCHKLAGSALGHFGAFLARQWRQNDILWGRLDGAERIISALLPNHPLRQQLIGEAQAQIICETVAPMGKKERNALLAESLMRTRTRKAESGQLDDFIRRLRENSTSDPKLNQQLKDLIDPNELRDYYEDNFRTRSKLEPESALRSAARATTVVGKILDSMSKKRGVNSKYSMWIIRLGQIFWSLVEVAVPQSFPDLIFRHWLKLVYFLELLLVVGSTVLLAKEVQQFALLAFGLTAGVHLAVVLLRDLIESRNRWVNLAKAIGAALLVGLIIVGGLSVSAMLGGAFGWNVIWTIRNFHFTEPGWGINLKSLTRVLLILIIAAVFLWSIRKDLKAFIRRS
ncbi:MAG TPA: DUF3376 domain-containing protein, partial [Pyrinomonadaceae bacterium]